MIDEDLPEGAVIDGLETKAPLRDEVDYVVVGSGAAGAVAAHTLAEAGYQVAIVEEGPWVKTREFQPDVFSGFQRLMRDRATQAMEGRSFIPLLQARCVGGTTVVNSAIAWRLPEDVLGDWSARFGVELSMRDLEPHYAELEDSLRVSAVSEEALGENNRTFIERANAIGIGGAPMKRYERGCQGSSRCLQGCPNAAKQGMNISYVPWALAKGARIYTSCRVDLVHVDNGRARAVLATTERREAAQGAWSGSDKTQRGHQVELIAKRGVFVAASTVQTPNILRRSGVRARDLGEHFMAHPGVALAAVFDRPVRMDFGATQGAESIHFRAKRFKLETLAMPPELAAARFPGAGRALMKRLATYPHVAVWAVQVRARAEGRVRLTWGGRDQVKYSLTKEDVMTTREALGVLGRMMFEHGAREVWPGVFGLPTVLTSADQVKLMEEGPTDPRAYNFVATHLFGAARMGPDPRSSVVGLDFQVHGAKGLYVVDSSVFPTNLGVNPQHTIMAVARLAATRAARAPLAKVA